MKPPLFLLHIGGMDPHGVDSIILNIILISFFFALIIGYYGKKKDIGFAKSFFISFFLTPVFGILSVWLSKKLIKCNNCSNTYKSDNDFCPACNKNQEGFSKEELEEINVLSGSLASDTDD